MKAEVWANEFGDTAIFVGDMYVIYDKVDRLEVETSCVYKSSTPINIDEVKRKYYKNGFRPLDEKAKSRGSSKCDVYEYNNKCCTGEGSIPCCTCNVIRVCPDQKYSTNNFKLKSIKEYE